MIPYSSSEPWRQHGSQEPVNNWDINMDDSGRKSSEDINPHDQQHHVNNNAEQARKLNSQSQRLSFNTATEDATKQNDVFTIGTEKTSRSRCRIIFTTLETKNAHHKSCRISVTKQTTIQCTVKVLESVTPNPYTNKIPIIPKAEAKPIISRACSTTVYQNLRRIPTSATGTKPASPSMQKNDSNVSIGS